MTRQTPTPLARYQLTTSNRSAHELARIFTSTYGDLTPAYQRGTVWTDDANGPTGNYEYAVIDGKQRIETAIAWFDSRLTVPASWFPADDIERTETTDDGPYLRYSDLTPRGQRYCINRFQLPVVEAKVATIEEEASLYLLVNGEGTPQTNEAMTNAARVAGGS